MAAARSGIVRRTGDWLTASGCREGHLRGIQRVKPSPRAAWTSRVD
ncbi:hypothetical protein [Kibdelosporangium philippinense]